MKIIFFSDGGHWPYVKQNYSRKFLSFFLMLLLGFLLNIFPGAQAGSSGTGLDNQSKSISSNSGNICFIRDDGEVVCRGEDKWDETDDGEEIHVVGISNARSISVDAGSFDDKGIWGCASTSDGSVYCWNFRDPPYRVGGINDAVSVVTGRDASQENNDYGCAVRSNGKVKCWGNNSFGQLGNGTTSYSAIAVEVMNTSGIVSLSTGTGHSTLLGREAEWVCAVRYTGGARCWGGGYSTPFAIIDLTAARQISIAAARVCILRDDGGETSIYCSLTTGQLFKNFSSYLPIDDLSAPTDMASDNQYGLQCYKDESLSNEWLCRDIYYGWPLGPGYMTSLSTNVRSLHLQDGPVACALKNDYGISCMLHGTWNRPCDVASEGADCIDENARDEYVGEMDVADPAPGTWYTFLDLKVYPPKQPIIFTAPNSLARDSGTSSSIRVSWNQGSSTSSSFDVRFKKSGTAIWFLSSSSQIRNGDRIYTTISGLQTNTQYEIQVRGRNWGSKTSYSSILTAKTN